MKRRKKAKQRSRTSDRPSALAAEPLLAQLGANQVPTTTRNSIGTPHALA